MSGCRLEGNCDTPITRSSFARADGPGRRAGSAQSAASIIRRSIGLVPFITLRGGRSGWRGAGRSAHTGLKRDHVEGNSRMEAPEKVIRAAEILANARNAGQKLTGLPDDVAPTTEGEAFAIQREVLRLLGLAIGGWKCAAPPGKPQSGAPMPASGFQ